MKEAKFTESDRGEPAGLTPEQRRALPPFYALRAFEAIVGCGGIRKAAAALSVDHAAVSRHLRSLEEWTGIPLIDRSPGARGRPTAAGASYYRAIVGGLRDIASAGMALRSPGDDHSLSIRCAPGLACDWLAARLGSFSNGSDAIELELQPSDTAPDLADLDIDTYIQYQRDVDDPPLDPALRWMELARPPILPVASPEFLNTYGPFDTPDELLAVSLIHEASFDQWRRWFAAHQVEAGGRLSGPKFWQNSVTLAAARRGRGITLANDLLVRDDLKAGRLVEAGDWPPVYLGRYILVARRSRWREHKIAMFRRWIEQMIHG